MKNATSILLPSRFSAVRQNNLIKMYKKCEEAFSYWEAVIEKQLKLTLFHNTVLTLKLTNGEHPALIICICFISKSVAKYVTINYQITLKFDNNKC